MCICAGDMEDSSTLRHHDVVPDAQLTLTIWKAWSNLVQACAVGNIADVRWRSHGRIEMLFICVGIY